MGREEGGGFRMGNTCIPKKKTHVEFVIKVLEKKIELS